MCLNFLSAFPFIRFILYCQNILQDQNINMSIQCYLLPQMYLPYGIVSFLFYDLLDKGINRSLAFTVSFYTVRCRASYAPLCLGNVNSLLLLELSVLLRIYRFACKHLWTERRAYVGFSQLPVLCICSANLLTLNFDIRNAVFLQCQYN